MKVNICSYEVFVVTNRFNWMDVSPGQSENSKYLSVFVYFIATFVLFQLYCCSQQFYSVARLAFCGQTGEIIFEFPLTIFMPLEQKVHFSAAVSLHYLSVVIWGAMEKLLLLLNSHFFPGHGSFVCACTYMSIEVK